MKNQPYWPAAMPLNQAAAYCGLSTEAFKEVCPVRPVALTPSTRGQRFLRLRLDEWLTSLDRNTDYSSMSALEAWKARKHARTT